MLNGPVLPAPFSRLGSWPSGRRWLQTYRLPHAEHRERQRRSGGEHRGYGRTGIRNHSSGRSRTPGKTDNRSGTRAIRIAVDAAIVRRSHGTAAPAAPTTMQAVPGGFGRNGW